MEKFVDSLHPREKYSRSHMEFLFRLNKNKRNNPLIYVFADGSDFELEEW